MDHLDFIKLLIAKGANVNARVCGKRRLRQSARATAPRPAPTSPCSGCYEDGATPFLRAAQSGDVELMKLLLAHGADPKIYTAHNVTPLAVASGSAGWKASPTNGRPQRIWKP